MYYMNQHVISDTTKDLEAELESFQKILQQLEIETRQKSTTRKQNEEEVKSLIKPLRVE